MFDVSASHASHPADVHLDVQLGRLRLANPITVASGTFGYAREMAGLVDLGRLAAILPKTITAQPRPGNPPPRTVETTGGMLNSIGLDNDGIEAFIEQQLPYLASLGHGRSSSALPARRTRSSSRWPPGWTACPASPPWN